jgi:hypothetical protein
VQKISIWADRRDHVEVWLDELIHLCSAFDLNLDILKVPEWMYKYTPDGEEKAFETKEAFVRVKPAPADGAAASPRPMPSCPPGASSSSGEVRDEASVVAAVCDRPVDHTFAFFVFVYLSTLIML